MKKIYKKLAITMLSLCGFTMLVGCGDKAILTPQDAVVDAFGNRQFRISFDSTNLDMPISDMYYSAKNMPVLPTPTKVGYVFAGWYFDQTYSELCDVEAGDLFWKMKNVTLYAKWNVEEIVNNGQYDIEYEAKIVEDSIIMGKLASKYDYYKFPEDIIEYGTYIEKNDSGIFLRIQYDSRTRGPVLGGADADGDNFSKQTYTITDRDNRISEELSIFDRTSTLQTIYYNIEGLKLDDTIRLFVEYYNWVDDMPEEDRASATVEYEVEFNITRFIGFGASFVNTEARLEDGIYSIPTHYCELDKNPSMLDLFNPVNSYIKASKGRYKLYKPMSAYNNDFPKMSEEHYTLRTTGFARELTYFLADQKDIVTKEQRQNFEGNNFVPSLLNAEYFQPITFEFNSKTGQYYYIFDLGKTLDKDIILLGGSSGAMESMFSFPLDYRRLVMDYKSMIRLADWPYEELTGDAFTFKETYSMYPSYNLDFEGNNTDFDHFNKNLSHLTMKNVFYTKKDGKIKIYDSKVVTSPVRLNGYISEQRYNYQTFDFYYEVFGYNPLTDGDLYSRDLNYSTNTALCFSNSSVDLNRIGKTYNKGEKVSLNHLYKGYVTSSNNPYEYEAYEVDDRLNINFNKKVEIDYDFNFDKNLAILFKTQDGANLKTSLVYVVEKQNAAVAIKKGWTLDETTKLITTDKRFEIGSKVTLPTLEYVYYGEPFSTRNLLKDDLLVEDIYLDFTHVSVWNYYNGIYDSYKGFSPAKRDCDFEMKTERVRALVQLENQFGEFENYMIEVTGKVTGSYEIKNGDEVIKSGDLKYDKNKRYPIKTEVLHTFDLINQDSINDLTKKFEITINDNERVETLNIDYKFALVYLKDTTIKVVNLAELWSQIKDKPYAIVCFTYQNDYGDQVIYKGQYNFMIEGNGINTFNIIDTSKMYFINQEITFKYPFVTKGDHKSLSSLPKLKVYHKVGNNFISNTRGSYTQFNSELSARVKFNEVGDYLLDYEINITTDRDGNKILDSVDLDDNFTHIKLHISEIIHIVDRVTDIEVTFVTDLAHPFNVSSSELEGFDIKTIDGFQYAKKKYLAGEKIKSLSYRAFEKTSGVLYKWGDSNKKTISKPGVFMNDVHLIMNTTNPYLYACFDNGTYIHVQYDKYGEIHFVDDVYTQKNPNTASEYYTVDTGSFEFDVPAGYEIYGWKADKNIFFEKDPNSEYDFYYTDFKKGILRGNLDFTGETTLTAIIKKLVNVNYKAFDTNGNELNFLTKLYSDYGLYIGDNFLTSLERRKADALKEATCTDLSKELLYWEVFDYELHDYVRIDLYEFVMLDKYSNNKAIELRAIFG